MTVVDWRLPENRREAFLRFYGFHLKYRSHPRRLRTGRRAKT